MIISIKELMNLERVLLEIDSRFKFELDFANAYKLHCYLRDIGDITSYAFEIQEEHYKYFSDNLKTKEYHAKIMNSSIDTNCKEIMEFVDKLLPNISGRDEEFDKIIKDIKFWRFV